MSNSTVVSIPAFRVLEYKKEFMIKEVLELLVLDTFNEACNLVKGNGVYMAEIIHNSALFLKK